MKSDEGKRKSLGPCPTHSLRGQRAPEAEGARRRVYLGTYGCQMNDYDSSLILSLLAAHGYARTDDPEDADLILLNACSVRKHAEKRALGRVSNLGHLKSRNPGLLIGILGCLAQSGGSEVFKEAPCVDFVLGPDCYRDLPDLILSLKESRRSVVLTDVRDQETYGDVRPSAHGISAFLPITRGCNNFCSYCIVPYTRGRERSRPADELVGEARRLAAEGVREITLLGQNVNSYCDGKHGFASLLRMMDSAVSGVWIRFTTSHPKDLADELIKAVAECENVCEHVHLPLQSGSSRILELMNRGYNLSEYMGKVEALRETIEGVTLTTDLLVGFPGETDEDFGETLAAVRKIGFDFAYMFAYSPRGIDRASSFDGQVPRETQRKRLEELISLQNGITRVKSASLVSRDLEVLVEGESKARSSEKTGRTRGNKKIVFSGEGEVGDIVLVRIEEVRGWTPCGRALGSPIEGGKAWRPYTGSCS